MRKLTKGEFYEEVNSHYIAEHDEVNGVEIIKETGIKFIRGDRFEQLEKKITKLQKKALSYGLEPPTFEVLEEFIILVPRDEINSSISKSFYEVPFKKVFLKADGIIKLNGNYRLIGIIDHKESMVRSVPEEEIPKQYFGVDSKCDHCNHKRYRVETFIVQNEEGEYKQIGRSCLKDYLGIDGNHVSYVFSALYPDVREYDEDDYFGGGYGEIFWNIKELIECSVVAVNRFGWLSQSAWNGNNMTTSSRVKLYLDPPFFQGKYYECTEEEILIPTETEVEEAKKVMEWAKNIDDETINDFLYNLKTIASKDSVTNRYFGMACAMFIAYKKAHDLIEKKEKRANEDAKSEHIGNVKDKMEFGEVTVEFSKIMETQWGYSTLLKFRDAEDNILIWWASGNKQLDVGEKVNIKGTIKKHDEYNNVKQTIITRVKF